ncbi:hypothetical protein FHT44_006143 [Mycolicibacterium sp. BK634]|uniref:AsnC family protein n=1 Tax=Mycolicibacterium sp. BK634 TaxID=2587099 RepID=UPI00160DBCE7|nr:AsnC family protein [Mycolicibacterium sp. BK634]MBB3753621.1 hypothetical protein [Mycolicibacterium sp. BK634]
MTEQSDGDAELYRHLCEEKFNGPVWKAIAPILTRYAMQVIGSAMCLRQIDEMMKTTRVPFTPTTHELMRLATDGQYRTDVLGYAVAKQLARFRLAGLDGKGWSPEGGASIKTYFVNGCVIRVIDELKKQREDKDHDGVADAEAREQVRLAACHDPLSQDSVDPAAVAIRRSIIKEQLNTLISADQVIVWGKASHWSAAEIAEHIGITPAAVNRRWAKLKAEHDWISRLGGEGQ